MEGNKIVYDLSQDIVAKDVKTLKNLSVLYIIQRLYNPELILQHLSEIYPEITREEEKMKRNKVSFSYIEYPVSRRAKAFITLSMADKIEEVTHLVCNQIFIFLSKNYYRRGILNKMLKNLQFTSQGTVNTRETFRKVIQSPGISYIDKFEIACRNFMEEDVILSYFRKLPEFIIYNYLSEPLERKEQIPVLFFLCRFTGITKKIEVDFFRDEDASLVPTSFSNVNNKSALEYLFYWSELTFNDMAVHYLWDEYISLLEDRRVLINCRMKNVRGDIRLSNFVVYILSNVNENEKMICVEACSSVFIDYLLQQARWHSSFIKIIEMLKRYFKEESYVTTLRLMISILCCKHISADIFSKSVFRKFLKLIPQNVKVNFILERESFMCNMLKDLFIQRDLESFLILMETDDLLGADRILMTEGAIALFEMFVCNGDWDFINGVFNNITSSSDDIREFKNKLLNRKGYGICDFFINGGKYEDLKFFLKWCLTFASKENISINLYMENGNLITKLLSISSGVPDGVDLADIVLGYCFHSKKKKNSYKRHISLIDEGPIENEIYAQPYALNLYTVIRKCAVNSKFFYLRKLFRWKNCDGDEVNMVKRTLLNDYEFFRVIFLEKNILEFIPEFSKFYNFRFNERSYFNKSFLKQERLFREKVQNSEYKLVRDLIEFLQPSYIEVKIFKSKLYKLTSEWLHSVTPPTPELNDFLKWITSPV